jgi:hypothetical protein
VVGDVTLGEHSSVWYGAVLRGDVNAVKIGAYTNIQARRFGCGLPVALTAALRRTLLSYTSRSTT